MNKIRKIINDHGLDIKTIKKFENSYSSSTYKLESKNRIMVLKLYKNQLKFNKELKYLNYLKNYIHVPKIIHSKNDYIIMEFIKGINYFDEQSQTIEINKLYILGQELAKLHSIKTIEPDDFKKYCHDKILETFATLSSFSKNELFKKAKLDLLSKLETISYSPVILHMDFRIGNIIFNHIPALIDLESVRTGDPIFDFVKMNRLLNDKQFSAFKEGYQSLKIIPNNFEETLEFYDTFDSYSSLEWCVKANRIEDEFYLYHYNRLENKYEY